MTDRRRVFVSYARVDREAVGVLARGLERLGCDVWFDEELTGGHAWWDSILAQIRASDVVVTALSPASLRSVAVGAETRYARDVGAPLLPVVVAPVRLAALPPELVTLQVVEFTEPGADAAFALAAAVANLPARKPLPDPLPPVPPAPVSYLSELGGRVTAPSLSLDEQLGVVARLREALSTEDREAALELLAVMRERRDLYHAVARSLDEAAAPAAPVTEPGVRWTVQPGADPEPGWTVRPESESAHEVIVSIRRAEQHRLVIRSKGLDDSAHLDGKKIMGQVGTWGWAETRNFRMVDGGQEFPATLRVLESFPRGRIKSVEVAVAGRTIYSYRA